jgi:hypothetical protein
MKKICTPLAAIIVIATCMTSCVTTNKSMREPYSKVDFTKNDFTFSEQVTGQGACTKVLGIDFYRWFHNYKNDMAGVTEQNGGSKFSVASLPVVGNYLSNKTAGYALFDLMKNNPGYDVIFYPQYESRTSRPILGIGFLYKRTHVKAMAKLAKLKP